MGIASRPGWSTDFTCSARYSNMGSNSVGATKGSGPGAGRQQPAERAVAGERVAARAGDEYGRAVDAIKQECLQHLACRCALTEEHAPHIVRAGAQLAGYVVAIYRDGRGRLR